MADSFRLLSESVSVEQHDNRADWLLARRIAIGASEAADVLGRSRDSFGSAWSVWSDKVSVDPPVDRESSPIQERGLYIEYALDRWFSDKTDLKTVDPGSFTIVRHADYPFLSCSPDRFVVNDKGDVTAALEFKSAIGSAAEEWKEKVPLGYQIQLQQTMLCCDLDVGYFAVDRGFGGLAWYKMERHDKFQERLIIRLGDFWREYVEKKVPPEVDHKDATRHAINGQYDYADVSVPLPDDVWHDHLELSKLTRQKKKIDADMDRHKNSIRAAMQGASTGVFSDGKTEYTNRESKGGSRRFLKKGGY